MINVAPQNPNGFDDATISPGQTNTRLEIDVPETVSIDARWGGTRTGAQIGGIAAVNKGIDSAVTRNMRYWPSTGAWTLVPLQERFSEMYEHEIEGFLQNELRYTPDSASSKLQLLVMVAGAYLESNLWSEPGGAGFVHNPTTVTKGDPMFRKVVGAGQQWVTTFPMGPIPPQLSTDSSQFAGVPEFQSPNVPLECVYYSKNTQDANQGYCIRWNAPGLASSTPDVILNFYFAEYALIIGGNGQAILAEYCQPDGGGAYRWKKRDTFRYCKQGRAVGIWHYMIVFPQKGPNGEKWIVFSGNEMDTAKSNSSVSAAPRGQATFTDEKLYHANQLVRFNDIDESPGEVTKAAHVRMDCRADMRVAWHVSPLVFANAGGIADSVWTTPDYGVRTVAMSDYPANPFQINIRADFPPDPIRGGIGSIVATIADSADPLATDIRSPFVTFNFAGTGTTPKSASYTTPLLWNYELYRGTSTRVIKPGKKSILVKSVATSNIAGPDPREERGVAVVQDVLGNLVTPLLNGGQSAARVVMDVKDGSGSKPVVLARGYAIRPKGTKRGHSGPFPSENWFDYSVLISGIADRASAVSGRSIDYAHFDTDYDAPLIADGPQKGSPQGWKITDIISYLLRERGFPADQVLIPDNPIRLWGDSKTLQQDAVYTAHSDVIGQCVALARNYLGGHLIFDANAGPLESAITEVPTDITPQGAWRLIIPPTPGGEPLCNFVINQEIFEESGHLVLPSFKGAYTENTYPIFADFMAYTIPPETNHLWVITAPPLNDVQGWKIDAHAFNYRSYDVPGISRKPDPDNPDHRPHFIGYEKMGIVPDASLLQLSDTAKIKRAVNFTTRRIFDHSCVGKRVVPAKAPLVLITDPETGRKRPLRYYDPVRVNGQSGWYVRSAPSTITTPNHIGNYEFERKVPLV